jgi:hypothetical protein
VDSGRPAPLVVLMNSAPNIQPSPRFPIAALLTLFAQLSGVQVTADGAKQPLKGLAPSVERAWIEVIIDESDALGVDEMRVQANAAGTGNVFLLRGERTVRMTLKGRVLDNTLSSSDLLERIRFRLHTDLAQGAYQGVKLSLASSGRDMKIRHYNEPIQLQNEDARVIRVAVMELKFNWCASALLSPSDQSGGGVIDTVNGGQLPGRVGPIPNTLT